MAKEFSRFSATFDVPTDLFSVTSLLEQATLHGLSQDSRFAPLGFLVVESAPLIRKIRLVWEKGLSPRRGSKQSLLPHSHKRTQVRLI
jgi:hypothetical protein